MPKRLSQKELEQIYPRSMFPNDDAWHVTIENRLNHSTCIDCPHFIDFRFTVDNILSFDGLCKQRKEAIAYKLLAPCEM